MLRAASQSARARQNPSTCLRPQYHRPRLTRATLVDASLLTRHVSTSAEVAAEGGSRIRNFFYGTSLVLVLAFGYLYITDTRAGIYQWLMVPALRLAYPDAEEAHEAGTKALKALYSFGVHPRERGDPDAVGDLKMEVFGHTLNNPIGTSAGIDKNADIPTPLLALGPAIVEIGGTTPYPQAGNPKPRVFRIPSQNALINRYGLNSEGAEHMAMRLRQRVREFAYHIGFGLDEEAERMVLDGEAGVPPGSLTDGKLLAVQVAKNKTTPDDDIEAVTQDYVFCANHLAKYADIITVNVSSPNTPGLRTLQRVEPLTHILKGVVQAAKSVQRKTKPAVMVKVSPDEDSDEQVAGICEAIWASGVDGVIVGNTTRKRPDPIPKGYVMPSRESTLLLEEGGYSGPQTFERTLSLVKRYRKLLDEGPKRALPPPEEQSEKPISGPSTGDNMDGSVVEKIEASQKRDEQRLKDPAHEEPQGSQPLLRLPERHSQSSNVDDIAESGTALSASNHLKQGANPVMGQKADQTANPFSYTPKVIFATGGITNGQRALEILNAGASVAMVYTALVSFYSIEAGKRNDD